MYHPTSTCRMAPIDQGGVVDSKLKVYGVDGLRVCDASIFPSIVSGHTVRFFFSFLFFFDSCLNSNWVCFDIAKTGACYATAEKLADQIKAEFAA